MSGRKLSEQDLEALTHGRRDLASEEACRAIEEDGSLAALLEREREVSNDASVALKRAAPDLPDLDAMVGRAIAKLPGHKGVVQNARPSRGSLVLGGALGAGVAIASSLLSIAASSGPRAFASETWGDLAAIGRLAITLSTALGRLVAHLPGGWPTLALAGLALVAILLVPLGAIARFPRPRVVPGTALALGLAVAAGTGEAQAWELEGEWPRREPVISVDVERAPLSEALRAALAPAGIGLVYMLPDDPTVTLHVRDAPLREVLDGLLADVPARVRYTGRSLLVRPAASASSTTLALPTARTPLGTPATQGTPGVLLPPRSGAATPTGRPELRDLVTFGSDAHVLPEHQVREVITMGGDARIEGHVFGDVVTMGGSAEVIGGQVVGDVVTMGGDIRIARGGRIYGQLNAMGGEVQVEQEDAAQGTGVQVLTASAERSEEAWLERPRRWVGELLDAAMRHALLFLLGLLFMGLAPARLSALQGQLVRQPLRSLASGFLGLIAGAVLTVVLVITIVGIPGAIVLALGLFLAAYLGLATTASVIGAALPIRALKDRPVLQLAVGVLILFLFSRMPVVGTLLTFIATLAGLGAVLVTRFGQRLPTGIA